MFGLPNLLKICQMGAERDVLDFMRISELPYQRVLLRKIALNESIALQNATQTVTDHGEFLHSAQLVCPASGISVKSGNKMLQRLV
ncbi:hypothetical protein D3C76_1191030 [compost metagenome]